MSNADLIAEAREFAGWLEPSEAQTADLLRRLADALESVEAALSVERVNALYAVKLLVDDLRVAGVRVGGSVSHRAESESA